MILETPQLSCTRTDLFFAMSSQEEAGKDESNKDQIETTDKIGQKRKALTIASIPKDTTENTEDGPSSGEVEPMTPNAIKPHQMTLDALGGKEREAVRGSRQKTPIATRLRLVHQHQRHRNLHEASHRTL